jgi:hypothetical protein
MLPRMRSAAPWLSLALLCSCSVYSNDLRDDVSLRAAGGAGAGAGPRAGSGGEIQGVGGSSAPDPVVAAGGDPANEVGGSTTAGTSGVSGGSASIGGRDGVAGSAGAPNDAGAAGSLGSIGGAATLPGDLLDGFEDEDLTLEQRSGRGGVWYLFDDGTVGSAGPKPLACAPLSDAPALLGSYALHVTAAGFTGWGSGLGVDFRAGKKVYDASKLSGLRFWARVGAGKNTHHRLQLADSTTDAAGGKCNPAPSAPEGEKCDDHFGINATFTSVWTLYTVHFSELTQIGWGNAAPALDKTALYGLQLTAKPKLDVDLWLDQIEFF